MQKVIKKPIVFLPLLMLLIITSLSTNKTMFPSASGLTSKIKATAIQFQYLKGSNRISEFKKLHSVLFTKTATCEAKSSSPNKTTIEFSLADIENILGPPDLVLSNTNWVYYLNGNQENCQAIFEDRDQKKTIYCTVSTCN
jgi:hypothetical protein